MNLDFGCSVQFLQPHLLNIASSYGWLYFLLTFCEYSMKYEQKEGINIIKLRAIISE